MSMCLILYTFGNGNDATPEFSDCEVCLNTFILNVFVNAYSETCEKYINVGLLPILKE